jgi:histidine triad (HIT) family protein
MENCIFCKIVRGEIPSQKVYEDEHVLAFLDVRPQSERHTLVIPKRHCADIFDTPEDIYAQVMAAVLEIVKAYEAEYGMRNVNIVNNSGVSAGQEVFHLHVHIIPRW